MESGKNPLIFPTISETFSFADSIGLIIASLIPFHTRDAVSLIELNTDETFSFMLETTVVTFVLMFVQMFCIMVFKALNFAVTFVFIALAALVMVVLIAAHVFFAHAFILSQFLYSNTPIAMAAAMAAIAIPIGPASAENAAPNAGPILIIVPIAFISAPTIIRTGPSAAVIMANANANLAIIGCCFM